MDPFLIYTKWHWEIKTLKLKFMNSVQSLSHVQLFVTPWTEAHKASLSITNSRSLLKLMSIESVMPSNHLILCPPLLLLPSIFPKIKIFSNESALRIRWPKYWSFSFSISPFNKHPGLIFRMTGWISLQSKGLSRVFSNTTVQYPLKSIHIFTNGEISFFSWLINIPLCIYTTSFYSFIYWWPLSLLIFWLL